jgi:SRSO17 transposase
MEKMAETIEGSDEQALQHFLSKSRWSYRDVMNHVAKDASEVYQNTLADTCLIVDESAIEKKGDYSVGVSRQWNGRLGKIENSQVGVFTALSQGNSTTLIDGELFLPESWAKDKKRCEKAKIPEAKRKHRTKLEMALAQIRRSIDNGIRHEWVLADSLYGRDYHFAMTLEAWGETFVLDIPENYSIYEHAPSPGRKEHAARGRPGTRFYSDEKPIKVKDWLIKRNEKEWKLHVIRKGTKGKITVKLLQKTIWVWDRKSETCFQWHIICRKNLDGTDLKLSLSNASPKTSARKLAYIQSQRHFVERAFQDAKSELGLAQYQARNWDAWHRHMSLVMMAMLFFVKKREYMRSEFPYITVSDLVLYFSVAIPDKRSDNEKVFEILQARNQKRERAHRLSYGDEPPSWGKFA